MAWKLIEVLSDNEPDSITDEELAHIGWHHRPLIEHPTLYIKLSPLIMRAVYNLNLENGPEAQGPKYNSQNP